tara:strand:+ start:1665 stop:1847 length:183 start_codon:yes stop_codon:yes gene_type:complete
MICVGLIAMGIVNEENHDVYRTKSGGSIYTPKEENKTRTKIGSATPRLGVQDRVQNKEDI